MEIITDPNSILHQKAKKIKKFDEKLQKLVHNMTNELFRSKGVGLAAPQISQSIRLIVIEYSPKRFLTNKELKDNKERNIPLTIMINPKITWQSKVKNTENEGCLSLPDIEVPIKRSKEIHATAQDINGKKIKIRAKGLYARVLQHEIDHLDGILLTDRINIKTDRIVFMGTPEFAAIILKRLINSPFKPYLVITEPDKPSGRGKTLTPPAVKILAKQENIETWQPKYISQIANRLSELMPDLFIVAAYGQIIPKDILNAAQFGGINVHPSLLPKYRGSTPIQSAILNGDKITGITIMKMDEKMDHGPILTQREVEVPNDFSFPDLNTGLAKKGASQLIGTIPLYLSKSVRGRSQNNENATYTKKIIKRDGLINWREKSKIIDRKIRAYYPWPGAHTIINGKKIKICQSHLENDKLIIDRVQLEGKKEMTFDEFKRGWRGNLDFLDKIS